MSRLCTRRRRGRERKVYHECCKEISPDTPRCAGNRSRASDGVVNVFYLPGAGVEGDSSRDLVELSFPYGLEKVGGEGWASCGGELSSTGAGPNLLRLPNGAEGRSSSDTWSPKKIENRVNYILSLVPETSRVAGLHITHSRGCQEYRKEKRIRWGEMTVLNKARRTTPQLAGRESSPHPWLPHSLRLFVIYFHVQ